MIGKTCTSIPRAQFLLLPMGDGGLRDVVVELGDEPHELLLATWFSSGFFSTSKVNVRESRGELGMPPPPLPSHPPLHFARFNLKRKTEIARVGAAP